ncbi:MAG: type II 3-dehydroquinate dehydratase, partial [Gammaproteobacteria bacterium]|nr:type II 3-dehydroquinate dehydratase [Gammaproteobacteria bacterium]
RRCQDLSLVMGVEVEFMQSNHEGTLVDWIQQAINKIDAIIINAGAYTHTSVAIHDALRAYTGYKLELHISNPHLRETFRHISYVSPAADGIVAGLGVNGYELAVEMLPDLIRQTN